MHTVYFIFTCKYNTMLPGPNGGARLRPDNQIWIDLISSSEESDDEDNAAGDNARQQLAGGADNERRQRGPPPQVDLNPYAPVDWNPNPVPPRVDPRRAEPPPTPPLPPQNQGMQALLARVQALQQLVTGLTVNQNQANTNTNVPQSSQPAGQQIQGQTLADLITQQQPTRKR